MKKYRKKEKDIAKQRIKILLNLADNYMSRDKEVAERYVTLAKKIAMKNNVRIPKKWKYRFCKKCKQLLVPGVNATFRIRKGRSPHIVIRCHNCNAITRYPYKSHRENT